MNTTPNKIRKSYTKKILLGFCISATLINGISIAQTSIANPKVWPNTNSIIKQNPDSEAKINAIIAKMTIEEKVGQVIQPEFKSITPEDVRKYHIGSIENGGGSVPNGNKKSSIEDWLNLIEPYYQASIDKSAHSVPIPMMWASDAVHGHNNVYGATLFPHNIGLGAANDPALIKRIGAVTAKEVRSLGMDWSFAPTIAVARDDRWGRTYESYSEDPQIVVKYAKAMVEGLQGTGKDFLNSDHVISTAKHFLGDGSTEGGRDQGDAKISEAELVRLNAAPYKAAIDAGVQSIMASYNSWHGVKMHGNKSILTDALKGQMAFDGMIMGDWNAHGQLPNCTNGNCALSFNAGLDIYNIPQDWKELHSNLVSQVKDGTISMERLDESVRRVLRIKIRAGIFEQASPKARINTYKPIGTTEHREVAREAVRKSLVLLKNNNVLPIKPNANILVTGNGADNIAMQTGGWTLSWQGNDNKNEDFPGATSIFKGILDCVKATGGKATLSADGSYSQKPDVAIVVFGEEPYAEFQGDQADVALHYKNKESLDLIRKLKAQNIPVVAVLLSGRPLYLNPQINASDAFVAAWLPGSEGNGIADVLIDNKAKPKYDFTGRLSFSWPKRPNQTPLNIGDKNYDPQFAYGYGLSYKTPKIIGKLREIPDSANYGAKGVYLTDGKLWNNYVLNLGDKAVPKVSFVGSRTAIYGSESLTLTPQNDKGLKLDWNGRTNAWFEILSEEKTDISREANGAMLLSITYKKLTNPDGSLKLSIGNSVLEINNLINSASQNEEVLNIPLNCFATNQDLAKSPNLMKLETDKPFSMVLKDVRLIETKAGVKCP